MMAIPRAPCEGPGVRRAPRTPCSAPTCTCCSPHPPPGGRPRMAYRGSSPAPGVHRDVVAVPRGHAVPHVDRPDCPRELPGGAALPRPAGATTRRRTPGRPRPRPPAPPRPGGRPAPGPRGHAVRPAVQPNPPGSSPASPRRPRRPGPRPTGGGHGGRSPARPPARPSAGPPALRPAGGLPAASDGLVEALDPLRSAVVLAERCLLSFYIYRTALWVAWHLRTTSQPPSVPASQPLPVLTSEQGLGRCLAGVFGCVDHLSHPSRPTSPKDQRTGGATGGGYPQRFLFSCSYS